jgi:hypothetical protein
MKKEIPFLKIKKVIRFRPADIDKWALNGGIHRTGKKDRNLEGAMFTDAEAEAGIGGETGANEKTGEAQA